MKLYHYTTVRNFKKIWESQSLKFSFSKRTNDIFEKMKIVEIGSISIPYEIRQNTKEFPFLNIFFDMLESYRQISLSMDYDNDLKGFSSPMMWGHYANSCKGVCIEIDSDRLILDSNNMWADKVEYTDFIPMIILNNNYEFKNKNDICAFINNNIHEFFYKKHFHWKYENEYRIISNEHQYLSIKDAITALYVPDTKGYAFREVKKLISDSNVDFYYLFPATSNGGRIIARMPVNYKRSKISRTLMNNQTKNEAHK